MFNFKLYKDFFKQTKIAGLIFSIFSLIISLIVPVVSFYEKQQSLAQGLKPNLMTLVSQ